MTYPSVAVANRALIAAEARSKGHEVKVVVTEMDMDWLECHASCSCGWKGRTKSARWPAHMEGRIHIEGAS